MTVSIEKSGRVWTVIHNRPEARNAMDPESAEALQAAFLEFDASDEADVAVAVASDADKAETYASIRPFIEGLCADERLSALAGVE